MCSNEGKQNFSTYFWRDFCDYSPAYAFSPSSTEAFLIYLPLLFGLHLSLVKSSLFLVHTLALTILLANSFPFHDLVIGTDDPYPFGKGGSGFLANTHYAALRPSFSVWQAQRVQVFLLKLKSFYCLSADLGSTKKPATSFFSTQLAQLLLHIPQLRPNLYFILSDTYGKNYSSHLPAMSSIPHFIRVIGWPMSWPGKVSLCSDARFLVVSLLLKFISSISSFGQEGHCLIKFFQHTDPLTIN